MLNFKPIPIGVEDFKRMVDDGYYFVDKTLMIQDIIDHKGAVNLYTRPRRFGKTLNMSMIQRYFEKTDEDNSYLFEGLKISQAGDKYKVYQGQFPVISLSLKSMKQPSFKLAFSEYKNLIRREFWRHRDVFESSLIIPENKTIFQQICNGEADESVYITAIRTLSDCLSAFYQKNVFILIDEYDVPLENSHFRGFYDEMVDLIRSAFESALKTNPSLEKGILTGCLRVSKESIFTGLNNLNVYPVTDNAFSEYFGFTEAEVNQIAEFYQLSDKFDEIKEWYDGYLFGETEIYNPWSVLKYIQTALTNSVVIPKPYWSNTSSNDIIRELIFNGGDDTRSTIEELMNGGTVSAPIYEDITYRNIDVNSDYIWSFLLFTGYLKPAGIYKKENNLTYFDGIIPNIEVQTIYQTTIMQWFNENVRASSRNDLFDAIINGDSQKFEDILCDWLAETISYYDGKENYYHGFVSGLLVGFTGYLVKSNRESGNGRPDILILAKRRRQLAIIIEIKATDNYRQLDAKSDEALQQIEEKKYDAELIQNGYQKIIKYGIAFCQKDCMVKLRMV
jgi:hypothetical protein